jgi:acetyl/propionyl-CoA carboxylase alpha subunit
MKKRHLHLWPMNYVQKNGWSSVKAAEYIKYEGAGTVEFW